MPILTNSGPDRYEPSLEEQLGEFETITTQGRDIALQDAREDAQDNAEYLDWWLRQGLPQGGFPQFPVGTRPILPDDNEGQGVLEVGQPPTLSTPPILSPTRDGVVFTPPFTGPIQGPIQVEPSLPDFTFNLPDFGAIWRDIAVTLPPAPPPPPPPLPPVNVCLPPPAFKCPC